MSTNRLPQPSGTLNNPLEPVAWVLFQIRTALEDAPDGRAPVWVRLTRGRRIGNQGLGPALVTGIRLVLDLITLLHELFMDLEELLVHVDPHKATYELLYRAAMAATSYELGLVLADWFDDPELFVRMEQFRRDLGEVERYTTFVPEPSDVRVIGAQIFELLVIGQLRFPSTTGPCVDQVATGRIRLLQWAFGHSLTVRGYGKNEDNTARVCRLGMRPLAYGDEASRRSEVSDVWRPTANNTPAIELYKVEFRGPEANADLYELQMILEASGYVHPAIPAEERDKFGPALVARLEIFQALNDLPRTGTLDQHTLHRLLHLDWASRNIARARPFDPRRFLRIPPIPEPKGEKILIRIEIGEARPRPVPVPGVQTLSGSLELLNPDADRPQDEKIAVETSEMVSQKRKPRAESKGLAQTRWLAWYPCGVTPPAQGEVQLPAGRGWIQHNGERSLFDHKEPLMGQFVGMASRPLHGNDKALLCEGGELSEGQAHSQPYFFAARETEPWRAGRKGVPDPARRIHPTPEGQSLMGRISGMYQWADIEALVQDTPAGHRLLLQGLCAQRSLCKEGGDARGMPDAGQICIGLATKSWWQAAKFATRYDASRFAGWAWSSWWPNRSQLSSLSKVGLVALATDWRLRKTAPLLVPLRRDPVVAVLVGLYGRHARNHDIDAYFDSVEVLWEYVPTVGAKEVQDVP